MADFCFSYLLANMRTVVQSQRRDFLALQDIVLQAFLAQMFNRQVDEELVRCNDLQMNILRIVITYVLQVRPCVLVCTFMVSLPHMPLYKPRDITLTVETTNSPSYKPSP